jgi:hypothetical protein
MNKIILNKILSKNEYLFYKDYQKEFDNLVKGNECYIYTNTGIHSYTNFTERKIKNIFMAGMYWNVPFDKIKPNLNLLSFCIIDRYPIHQVDLSTMNNLKILFVEDTTTIPIDNDCKYSFFANLPNNLEILIIYPSYYIGLDHNFFSSMKNLPINLKYLIFSLTTHLKNFSVNDLNKIKLPLNCSLCYSQTICRDLHEEFIKLN